MDLNNGGGQDEQNLQFVVDGSESPNQLFHLLDTVDPWDSNWMNQDNQGEAGTVHGAPQGSWDELNSLNGSHLQSGDFGNQSVAGTEQPVVTLNQLGHGQDSSEFLDSILTKEDNQAVAGTVQPDAPEVVSEVPISGYGPDLSEFLDSTGINQNNQAIAGTGQPDPTQGVYELVVTQLRERSNLLVATVTNALEQEEYKFHQNLKLIQDIFGQENSSYFTLLNWLASHQKCHSSMEEVEWEYCKRNLESHNKRKPLIRQTSTSARDQNRLSRKRENDRAYRQRKKAKTQELEDENEQLKKFVAEVRELNDQIQKNKHLMKSELVKLLEQNVSLENKILQLQVYNRSVREKLETQSMKLDQLQDKLEFTPQLTTEHLDEQRNGKAKETLKEMAKKLEALRAEHEEMVAAVKEEEILLGSLLSSVQSIRIQLFQLLKEMPHNAGEEDSAMFRNS